MSKLKALHTRVAFLKTAAVLLLLLQVYALCCAITIHQLSGIFTLSFQHHMEHPAAARLELYTCPLLPALLQQ